MLVHWRALNGRQLVTTQCDRGAERKQKSLTEEEMQEISERAFQAYGGPLDNMKAFKNIGRVMTAGDDD